ncbi:hypothetical protein GF378_01330 [Candidatus Pacearchaeota archaeon]|nr:hypothetical protein [Candidatus Pacearchaeota archaeon]
MGDIKETDYYVLKVPIDTDCKENELTACKGDAAQIYIDGYPVSENPIVIGKVGEFEKKEIKAETNSKEPELKENERSASSRNTVYLPP